MSGTPDQLLALIRSRDEAGIEAFIKQNPHLLNEYVYSTPLHYAVTMNRVESVRALVRLGADKSLQIQDMHYKKTALQLAEFKKNQEIIDILSGGMLKVSTTEETYNTSLGWRKDAALAGYGSSVAVPSGGIENEQGLRITSNLDTIEKAPSVGSVAPQPAFCSSCGTKFQPNSRFCASCGAMLK